MALSYVETYGNGSNLNFPYSSISLLDDDLVPIASQLRVYIDGTLKTLSTDYSVNTTLSRVEFVGSAPLSSELVRIARYTKSDDRYINYTNSTNITADILNTDAQQIFFLAQEAKDLQNDAMTVGSDGKWNGQGKIIGNIAAGVDGTDAVNVAQLQAAVLGTTPASLGGHGYQQYTGDGSTTSFALPSAITSITSPEDIDVYVNGIHQTPTTAYSLSSGNIVFSPAPPNTSKIEILWLQGVLSGILGADAIDTSMIQNGVITAAKIDAESSAAGTVLKSDGAGNATFSTITSSSVSDFDTQVRTSRLNQMTAPNADVSMAGYKLTNVANPSSSNDAINLSYFNSNTGNYDKNTNITLGNSTVTAKSGTYSGNEMWRGGTLTYTFNTQPGTVNLLVPVTMSTPSGTEPNMTFSTIQTIYVPVIIPLSSSPAMVNSSRPIVVLIHDGVASSQSICFMTITWSNPSGNTIAFSITLGSPADSAQNRRPYFQGGSLATAVSWTKKNTQ
jgi:hypothetical protein